MTVAQKAVELRRRVKKKKPDFVRQESWRYKRLKENWRRPRGIDNKMRRKIKGWPVTVSVGYRGPKVARGLHPSGYKEVLVHNAEELKKINPKTEAVRIAHAVGKRKKARILVEARKRKIRVLNFKEEKEAAKEEVAEEKEEEKPEEETEEKAEAEKPKRKKTRRRRKRDEKHDES
ncbi:50S ribosomal protein L32e [Candidatus Bathyarchaeota archaeon]|nr:MAG: 50S ribosomal protein L32e [Candidatus Bathyarchaeota archaeon]